MPREESSRGSDIAPTDETSHVYQRHVSLSRAMLKAAYIRAGSHGRTVRNRSFICGKAGFERWRRSHSHPHGKQHGHLAGAINPDNGQAAKLHMGGGADYDIDGDRDLP